MNGYTCNCCRFAIAIELLFCRICSVCSFYWQFNLCRYSIDRENAFSTRRSSLARGGWRLVEWKVFTFIIIIFHCFGSVLVIVVLSHVCECNYFLGARENGTFPNISNEWKTEYDCNRRSITIRFDDVLVLFFFSRIFSCDSSQLHIRLCLSLVLCIISAWCWQLTSTVDMKLSADNYFFSFHFAAAVVVAVVSNSVILSSSTSHLPHNWQTISLVSLNIRTTPTHPHPQRHNNSHYESLWLFTDISAAVAAAAAVFFLFHSLIKMKTLPLHHTTNTKIVKLDFFLLRPSAFSLSLIFRFVHSIWHFIPERKEKKKHFFAADFNERRCQCVSLLYHFPIPFRSHSVCVWMLMYTTPHTHFHFVFVFFFFSFRFCFISAS